MLQLKLYKLYKVRLHYNSLQRLKYQQGSDSTYFKVDTAGQKFKDNPKIIWKKRKDLIKVIQL